MKNKIFLIPTALFIVAGLFLCFAITGHDYLGFACFLAAALIVFFKFAGKKLRVAVIILLLAGVLAYGIFLYPVAMAATTNAHGEAEYIVVLGAGLNGDVPSLSLTNRLTAALKYMEEYPDCTAIVSGGQGPGENMTEAAAMAIWLEARGVDPDRIIEEGRSTSTQENLEYSFEIIRQRGDEPNGNVALVTSEYHLCRAVLVARAMDVEVYRIAGETTLFSLKINYFIREGFAMAYYKIFGGI